jgi:hypothetical protein
MSEPKDTGKHDAGKTSESKDSGKGGKHSAEQPGYHLGTRRERPHHADGWESRR